MLDVQGVRMSEKGERMTFGGGLKANVVHIKTQQEIEKTTYAWLLVLANR